nr:MAG TPA: hypothetical protein [Caudoviricetes sp.]
MLIFSQTNKGTGLFPVQSYDFSARSNSGG